MGFWDGKADDVRGYADAGYSMTWVANFYQVSRNAVAGIAARKGIKFHCTDPEKSISPETMTPRTGKAEQKRAARAAIKERQSTAVIERKAAQLRSRPLLSYFSAISGAQITKRNPAANVKPRCIWNGCECAPFEGRMTCKEHTREMKAQGGLVKCL